jgi:hypothetical protein
VSDFHQRFDVGTLGKVEKTPQGGYRVPAFLTRTGVFQYQDSTGKRIAEYRPPEEVFHADSLATLPDAPVTLGHPSVMVNSDNHGAVSLGHVRDVKQDDTRIAATMVVQGKKAIKAIESGVNQVSCGYTCRTDDTPGIAPDGTPYDRVQRDIRYNHAALVTQGRAGADIRLRLDSHDDQISPQEPTMEVKTVERIDGVAYDVDSDAHKAARTRSDEAIKASRVKLETEAARADAAEAKLKAAELALIAANDPKRLDGLVASRTALLSRARAVLGTEAKFDGLSERAVQESVLAKVAPDVKLEGRGDEAVAVLFEAMATSQRADSLGNGRVVSALGATQAPSVDPMEKARLDMVEEAKNAWKPKEAK